MKNYGMTLTYLASLNQVVKRITSGTTLTDSGDISDEFNLVAGDIAIRFCNNEDYQSGEVTEGGFKFVSEQIGFILSTIEIEEGDYIFNEDSYKEYRVTFVDDAPGGVVDHHKEIYLKNTNDIAGKGINVLVLETLEDSFTISWDTFVGVQRAITYGENETDEDTWATTDFTVALATSGSVEVPTLDSNTKYCCRIISKLPDDTEIKGRKKDVTTSTTTCNTPFVFNDVEVACFKTGLSTYLRFTWNTDYDKAQKIVRYRVANSSTWIELGWTTTTGKIFSTDSVLPIGKRSYEWYVGNQDSCGNIEFSDTQTCAITYNIITEEYIITDAV